MSNAYKTAKAKSYDIVIQFAMYLVSYYYKSENKRIITNCPLCVTYDEISVRNL